jgi:Transposase DDE domain
MHAQLDDLLTATYVLVDDFLPKRRGPGRPPRITDAELITLAIVRVFMGLPNDRQFLALAGYRLSHLFAYLPRQSGYNKRLRALTPQIERTINYLAFCSGWCDQLRLLDSTPVPCAASRNGSALRVRGDRSLRLLPRSHSRYFWGFRLYLLCASHGTPIAFELAPANALEREVAREMLERVPLAGLTVIADKGFAGAEFEG